MRGLTAILLLVMGCGSPSAAPTDPSNAGAGGSSDLAQVEVGVPGGSDGLEFTPFEDGSVLDLHTFGQGGTHVLLALRCTGFGSRAFVALTVKNLNSGTELFTPAPARPQLLYCDGPVCDLVPITMMMSGITPNDAERDGLPIEVTANVHNAAGVSGEDSLLAKLSTANL